MSNGTTFTTSFGPDGTAYVRNDTTGITTMRPPFTRSTGIETEDILDELTAAAGLFSLDTNYVNMVNRVTKPKFNPIDFEDPEFFQKIFSRVKEMTADFEAKKSKQIDLSSQDNPVFQDIPLNY